MDIKTITVALVAVMVGAVVFGATLPIWQDLEDEHTTTYTNNATGYTRASLLDLTGTHTITNTNETLIIDGESKTFANYTVGIASDVFNGRRFGTQIQFGTTTGANITGNINITITNGVVNGTVATKTYTDVPIHYLAYPDPNGDYAMLFSDTSTRSIYLNNPAEQFYTANYINTTSEWFSYYNGVLTVGGEVNDTITFNGSQVDYDTEVYRYSTNLDDITFTVDNNGEDYTVHPYVCVIPYQVYGMASVENHMVFDVLEIIPLMMVLGLLIGAIGWVISKKF